MCGGRLARLGYAVPAALSLCPFRRRDTRGFWCAPWYHIVRPIGERRAGEKDAAAIVVWVGVVPMV